MVVIQILRSTPVKRDIVSHPHVIKTDPSTAIEHQEDQQITKRLGSATAAKVNISNKNSFDK